MKDLPTLLRVERAARQWSQERASLALGWRFHRYRRIASAMARPTTDEINAIAQVFGVTPRAVRAAVSATSFPDGNGEAASVA
jgi:transcriptional regulator with XRE-family HTH domain